MSKNGLDALDEHARLLEYVRKLLPEASRAAAEIITAYGRGGRVYTFGNGGSSADAAHFAEELLGRYKRERRPLAAQSLFRALVSRKVDGTKEYCAGRAQTGGSV